KIVTRAISRARTMTIALPDVGPSFVVQPVTAGNTQAAQASAGRFSVMPGVYVLSKAGPVDLATMPARIGYVGFKEYHAPPGDTVSLSVQSWAAPQYLTGQDAEVRARVVDVTSPDSVTLFVRSTPGGFYRGFSMRPAAAYEYTTSIPSTILHNGPNQFVITVFRGDSIRTFPAGSRGKPTDWNYSERASWKFEVVDSRTALRIFDPAIDAARLAFTRIGDAGRRGVFRVAVSPVTGQPVFHIELPVDTSGWSPADYTASLVIESRVAARQETIAAAQELRLRLRGLGARQTLHLTLMEDDGTSWTAPVDVDSSWSEQAIPLANFTIGRGVLLPQGFPGEWNYWVGPAGGRGGTADRPRLQNVERLQLSLRREAGVAVRPGGYGVEVESVTLSFDRR
ncbi:MAG TPA: hypothetical protein VK573_08020, partial [Gemmatimonadales bacterium]|nr:hypothetical protein [Gemmatimonadales bacterium]